MSPLTSECFRVFSQRVSHWMGSVWATLAACCIIALWAILGPLFGFSDTWQLFINTLTTLVTFLMVFIIQSTQNRNDQALHLKLDEIIRSMDKARNTFINLEDVSEEELASLKAGLLSRTQAM